MKLSFVLFCFVFCAVQALYEGDVCTKDGRIGICTRFPQCPTAFQDLLKNKMIQNCGYHGSEPIVCCTPPSTESSATPTTTTTQTPVLTTTKRSLTEATTEYIPPTVTYVDLDETPDKNTCPPVAEGLTSPKTGQKSWDKCIEYQDKLVIPCVKNGALIGGYTRRNACYHNADELVKGGNASERNEFPHMVLLGFGDDVDNLQWLCGGSLISERFILTAAHCLATEKRVSVSYVALGVLKRSEIERRNIYKIKKHYPYPDYNPNFSYHDIALLELEKDVPLDEFTVPACLHSKNVLEDDKASATGWGHTKHEYRGSTSEVLQKVILTKFDVQDCAVKYEKHGRKLPRGFDPYTQVCYGDKFKTKDTCQGDSGGPLQIKNKQIACMYTIIGVTSLGKPCVYADTEPGIYTRVFQYLNWIEKKVWP